MLKQECWPVKSLRPRREDRAKALVLKKTFPVPHLMLVQALIGRTSYFLLTHPSPIPTFTFTHFYNEDRGSSFSESLVTTYIVMSVAVKVLSVCILCSLLPCINMKDAIFCYSVSHKRQSLGRYSSLADSDHGVCLFVCFVSHKCLKVWMFACCSGYSAADHPIVIFIKMSDVWLWNVVPICTNYLLIVQSFNLMSRWSYINRFGLAAS
jgi:hypothetical protein